MSSSSSSSCSSLDDEKKEQVGLKGKRRGFRNVHAHVIEGEDEDGEYNHNPLQRPSSPSHPGRGLTRGLLGASSRRRIFGMVLRFDPVNDGHGGVGSKDDDEGSVGRLDGFEDPSDSFHGHFHAVQETYDRREDGMRKCNSLNGRRLFLLETRQAWSSQYSQFSASTFEESIHLALCQSDDGQSRHDAASSAAVASLDSLSHHDETLKSEAPKFHTNKKVVFGDVSIHEHPIIVGQNPGGTQGVPVTIDWKSCQDYVVSLDRYEEARAGKRRQHKNLRMSKDHRDNLLRKLGFPRAERLAGMRAANIVRQHRRQTNASLDRDRLQERLEIVRRRIRTVITLGRIKAQERAYLNQVRQTVVKKGKDGKEVIKTVWKPAYRMDSQTTPDTSVNSSRYSKSLSNATHHNSIASLPSILKHRLEEEDSSAGSPASGSLVCA
jgi:hypothetical protein